MALAGVNDLLIGEYTAYCSKAPISVCGGSSGE